MLICYFFYSLILFSFTLFHGMRKLSLGHEKNEEGALRYRSVIIDLFTCFGLSKNIICLKIKTDIILYDYRYFCSVLFFFFSVVFLIFSMQRQIHSTNDGVKRKDKVVFSIKILLSYLLNFAYNDEIVSLWTSNGLKALNFIQTAERSFYLFL